MSRSSRPAVIITGAGRRIGQALALHLSDRFDIILHYHTSTTGVNTCLEKIRQKGHRAWKIKHDLSREGDSFIKACARFAPLQGLINNASSFDPATLQQRKLLSRHLHVNALSPLSISLDFARVCKDGFIINFLDADLPGSGPSLSSYRLSKRFLHSITLELALELAPGVRVNAIAPGPILPASGREKQFNRAVRRTPLGRSPGIEAIYDCADFIIDSNFLTGQVLYADSGAHLRSI